MQRVREDREADDASDEAIRAACRGRDQPVRNFGADCPIVDSQWPRSAPEDIEQPSRLGSSGLGIWRGSCVRQMAPPALRTVPCGQRYNSGPGMARAAHPVG